MKRSAILLLSTLLLALTAACLATDVPQRTRATATPDHVALSWTANPATTMTITWRTDSTVTTGFVRYQKGKVLADKAGQVKAESRDFTTDLGDARIFSATLTNLAPGTEYSYRVGEGSNWSQGGAFKTADRKTNAFKFLLFGDSQAPLNDDLPYGLWMKTLQNASRANPDARFFVNVGDLVDLGQNEAHWNAWFAAAKGVIDRIPAMPSTGNHESYGSRDTRRPEFWKAQFTLPKNGPEGLKGQVYSYDYGSAHFVVLDSQQEEQAEYGDILTIQQSWLEADLAASHAKWKFAFFHRPPYGVMARRNNSEIKAAFCPILEKYHVDLVFSGHDHGIARTYPIRKDALMGTPSQGVIYYVAGQSGGKTYGNLEQMPWDAFFYNPRDLPNYFVVEIADSKLTVKTIKQDGTVLDTFAIQK